MKANPPGTVLVSEAALSEAWGALAKLESTNHKVAALLYLMDEQFRHQGFDGTMGRPRQDRLSCGVALLSNAVVAELDGNLEAAFDAQRVLKGLPPLHVKGGAR